MSLSNLGLKSCLYLKNLGSQGTKYFVFSGCSDSTNARSDGLKQLSTYSEDRGFGSSSLVFLRMWPMRQIHPANHPGYFCLN